MSTRIENKDRGKRRLIQEWGNIRRRWKRRKYDLRAELDVGSAVRASFDQLHTSKESEPNVRRSVAMKSGIDSFSRSRSRKMSFARNADDDPPSTWIGRLDDWANGYQTPKVEYCYWECREMILTEAISGVHSPSTDACSVGLGYAPGTATKRTQNFSFRTRYFPSAAQKAPTWFVHNRSLPYLVSGLFLGETYLGPTRTKTRQRRLIAYLWDSGCVQSVSHSPSMMATRRNGNLFRFFYQVRWKRRLEAAVLLGIASCRYLRGPLQRLGERALNSSPKLELMAPPKRLIRTYGGGTYLAKEFLPTQKESSAPSEEEAARLPGLPSKIPSFPLDAPLVSLGPEDLYHFFLCRRGGLSQLSYQIVLSMLLRASVGWNIRKDGGTASHRIASVSDILLELNQGYVQKCLSANRTLLEVPLIDYAFALDSACALSSNALPASVLPDSGKGGERQAALIAATPFVDRWLHGHSPKFATVYVRFSLLYVALCLPGPVSVLFLRSLDAEAHQTPFDAMRCFLDQLEASHFLIEAGSSSSCSDAVLPVEELECILYSASGRLIRILERDPLDFSSRCWHLATLAACMVLCSGNRIESGAAHRFPSGSTTRMGDRNAMLSPMNLSAVPHEVRRKLPKFHRLRLQTSRAFGMLLSGGANQNEMARWHLAAVSFLEWRQVIAFLLGSKMSEQSICQVNREHERHSVWLSAYASTHGSSTAGRQKPCNVVLDGFARLLESNPAKQLYWVQLVRELGPFRDPAIDELQRACNCSKCFRPLRSRQLSHEAVLDDAWWGRSRVSWWDVCILSNATSRRIVPSDVCNESCAAGLGDLKTSSHTTDPFRWLGGGESKDNEDCDGEIHSPEERCRNFDDCLPDARSRRVGSYNSSPAELENLTSMTSEFEGDLLKLVIRGHLYGITDPAFEATVISFAQESWDFSNGVFHSNSVSFAALQFLQQKGLNLAAVFQRANIPSDSVLHGLGLNHRD